MKKIKETLNSSKKLKKEISAEFISDVTSKLNELLLLLNSINSDKMSYTLKRTKSKVKEAEFSFNEYGKKIKRMYETKLDSKKRITIRGGSKKYYQVKEFEDDSIQLIPMLVVPEDEISKNTLMMLENSVKNLKKGRVSEPIKLDKISFPEEE